MKIETPSVNLYYEKKGSGSPIILLHGNGETHHIFDGLTKFLQNKFTVYSIDTRGHGESGSVKEYHYDDMADDIYYFINKLELKQPILYGFSDGGIVGLILASKHTDLLSKLIISGANTTPNGLKENWHYFFKMIYFFTKDEKIKLMLNEPNITNEMLSKISIPVFVTSGSKDMIKMKHTKELCNKIPNTVLKIFENETHDSYVLKNNKLNVYLIEILGVKNL